MFNFIKDEDGVAAIEFALILAIVGTAFFVGGEILATSLDAWLTDLDAKVAEAKAVLAAIEAAGV